MQEYRCSKCNELLFKGEINKGSIVIIMCKKKHKKYGKVGTKNEKCKEINIFGGK